VGGLGTAVRSEIGRYQAPAQRAGDSQFDGLQLARTHKVDAMGVVRLLKEQQPDI